MKEKVNYYLMFAAQFVPIVKDLGANPALNEAMKSADLSSFLNAAFKVTIIVGAMLAVARVGYGGFLYMGSDSWTNKSHAKEVLVDALTGLVILLAIVLILQYINPQILNLNLTPAKVSAPSAAGIGKPSSATLAADTFISPFSAEPPSP